MLKSNLTVKNTYCTSVNIHFSLRFGPELFIKHPLHNIMGRVSVMSPGLSSPVFRTAWFDCELRNVLVHLVQFLNTFYDLTHHPVRFVSRARKLRAWRRCDSCAASARFFFNITQLVKACSHLVNEVNNSLFISCFIAFGIIQLYNLYMNEG